jgi:KDO2-lipid IV(A) lauroyltransferase
MLASLALAALGALARALPVGAGYAMARAGAHLHRGLAARRRRAVEANLRRVAAHDPAWAGGLGLGRLVRDTFANHGTFMYEWLRASAGGRAELVLDGREHLEAALAAGRGAILVTCHLGNWEVAACELARAGYPLAVVTGEQLGGLAPAVRRDKARRGILVLRPADGMRALYRALAANRILVLLVDGDVWLKARTVAFLGRPAAVPCGAHRLARSTGAPLMAAAMRRRGPLAFHATIHPPVEIKARPEATLGEVLRPLEQAIARDPAQWCLFRPLWDEPTPAVPTARAPHALERGRA